MPLKGCKSQRLLLGGRKFGDSFSLYAPARR
jgi:hypothetical protein